LDKQTNASARHRGETDMYTTETIMADYEQAKTGINICVRMTSF